MTTHNIPNVNAYLKSVEQEAIDANRIREVRTYLRESSIHLFNPATGVITQEGALEIGIGNRHPAEDTALNDFGMRLVSFSWTYTGKPFFYEISVTYQTTPEISVNQTSNRAVLIETATSMSSKTVTHSIDGKEIPGKASAPLPMTAIRLTINGALVTNAMRLFAGTVNNGTFLGFGATEVMYQGYDSTLIQGASTFNEKTKIILKFLQRQDTWVEKRQNVDVDGTPIENDFEEYQLVKERNFESLIPDGWVLLG
jgi:hypothetical protein